MKDGRQPITREILKLAIYHERKRPTSSVLQNSDYKVE
jgi:hypothetical protein